MKQVLSLLTAFIFLQMQTWALSGGPVYPTGAPNLAGIYSGVMLQQYSKFGEDFGQPNSGSQIPQDSPAGNIGVYSVTVPIGGGVSTGDIIMFISGTMFDGTGTLIGVADPDKGTFDGLFTCSPVLTFQDQNGNPVPVSAEGQMRAKIIEQNTTPLPGQATTGAGHAARMTGTAIADAAISTNINLVPIPLVQTKFSVSGFRQITTPFP